MPISWTINRQATVEISSRFDGVIKKIHYATGAMAKVRFLTIKSALLTKHSPFKRGKVGSALVDIEVEDLDAATSSTEADKINEAGAETAAPNSAPLNLLPSKEASAGVVCVAFLCGHGSWCWFSVKGMRQLHFSGDIFIHA